MMKKRTQMPQLTRRREAQLACLVLAGSCSGALGLSFNFGPDSEVQVDWDTNVAYTAQWRVEDRDEDKFRFRDTGDLIGDLEDYAVLVNADDGNNNFDRGLVQNKLSIVSEMDINWRNFGLFLRGRAFYDDVYHSGTDISRDDFASYNNSVAFGGDAGFREFPDDTVDAHRDRLEMLDYFVYMDGELPGDRLFNLRLGSQVINWGEATFTSGINGLQNRADLIARNTPGVEVKEILLPTGSVYAQVDLAAEITLEAYYQYEWRETELNGVGSYFSDRDFLGFGARNFLIPFGSPDNLVAVPKTPEDNASDTGQWGTALHWFTQDGTDFGLYYINAHNKSPAQQVNFGPDGVVPVSYTIRYFEDIQGYAASFTTVAGITNIQGEVSLKADVPVVRLDGAPVKGDLYAFQLGGSHVLEPNALWDDANLTFEIAGAYIGNYDSSELRFDDHGSVLNLRLELSYLNLMPGLDLKVPVFFRRGLGGNILETEMVEDATAINLEFQFIYLNNFTTKIGYSHFADGGVNHLIADRDNISLNLSYSF
tara:strand:+ start:3898 stop:5514 length:1617 start_codon:yes stop_codon:yes gene_type:complete